MIFDGRDIPEEAFRRLARRAFSALLEEQDAQVAQAKSRQWFKRSEATEQAMFSAWLTELKVDPFPFRIMDPK